MIEQNIFLTPLVRGCIYTPCERSFASMAELNFMFLCIVHQYVDRVY